MVKSQQVIWRAYLRKIGGRKNLRPGEEFAVKEIIYHAMLRGGCLTRDTDLAAMRYLQSEETRRVIEDRVCAVAITEIIETK